MKPIIMSTEDVLGTLDGRKTMMRLVAKVTPPSEVFQIDLESGTYGINEKRADGTQICMAERELPYKPGDALWVREVWRVGAWDDEGSICVDYKADGFVRREWLKISDYDLYEDLWQQSSDDAREARSSIDEDGNYTWLPGQSPTRWRPSIQMPREAARLFLRVTDVRAERNEDNGQWIWVIEFEKYDPE